jgi:histidinol-phosphatase
VTSKPDRTFVTEADTSIERVLRSRLADAHPDHGIVGEEFGVSAAEAGIRWYLDPIDATHNFMRGIPVFATLLAVERDGELQAAAISAPALHERWYGWRGGGAWARGPGGAPARRLRVSAVASIRDAQLVYGSPHDVSSSRAAPGFHRLVAEAWRDRGFGDFWGHALVAEGAAEAMLDVGLAPWDIAAPMLIVEEAGGRVTDLSGGRSVEGRNFLSSNGVLHDALLERLAGR